MMGQLSTALVVSTRSVLTTLFITAIAAAPAAAIPSPQEIVNKANLANFYIGRDGTGVVKMLIVDGNERKQRRQFSMYRRTNELGLPNGGNQEFFVLFTKPSDIRNTSFLVEKHLDKDDNRWLYLPGLDLIKRISAGDKRTSFVGSHMFYEDLTGRNTLLDQHELLKSTDKAFVIKSTPKNKTDVRFEYYELWVDKKTFLPMKYVYHDSNGKAYRTIETVAHEDIGGFPTITRLKVSDLDSGGYTLVQYNDIEYNVNLPVSIFTENSLRNPPR